MNLLLSTALSFSPFGAPPPALRDWPRYGGSGSTRCLGWRSTRALRFPRLRPRGGTAGSPARYEEEPLRARPRADARLRCAPSLGALPPPALVRSGARGEQHFWSCSSAWHAARRSGKIRPSRLPAYTQHTNALCKIMFSQLRSMPPSLFFPSPCIYHAAKPAVSQFRVHDLSAHHVPCKEHNGSEGRVRKAMSAVRSSTRSGSSGNRKLVMTAELNLCCPLVYNQCLAQYLALIHVC
jgi:hypothetical protein